MRRTAFVTFALFMVAALAVPASAQLTASGRLKLLRVHDVGSTFGPPNDVIDVEVVIALDTHPNKFFGFQLRNDAKLPARQAMLDLLRDAFERNQIVSVDYTPIPGRNNFILFRTWLSR